MQAYVDYKQLSGEDFVALSHYIMTLLRLFSNLSFIYNMISLRRKKLLDFVNSQTQR